jgi:ribosome-associated translation inhibitor RaiA
MGMPGIDISCNNISLRDQFKSYCENIAYDLISKNVDFHENPKCHISFSRNGKNITSCVVISSTNGFTVKNTQEGKNPSYAFDLAISKISHALKKHRDIAKSYHKRSSKGHEHHSIDITKLVLDYNIDDINSDDIIAEDILNSGKFDILGLEESKSINIVEEVQDKLETLTVSEAIAKMELRDLPAIAFKNATNNKNAFLYQRKDGRLSIIHI